MLTGLVEDNIIDGAVMFTAGEKKDEPHHTQTDALIVTAKSVIIQINVHILVYLQC
jgi:hypothetical protein